MTESSDLIHDGTRPDGSAMSNGALAESDRNSLSLSANGPLLSHNVPLVDTVGNPGDASEVVGGDDSLFELPGGGSRFSS
jgi:hypothetical protein